MTDTPSATRAAIIGCDHYETWVICAKCLAQALDARTAESEQEMGQVIADAFRNGELAEAAKHADCFVDRERTAQMEQQLGLARERIAWLESLMPGVNP